MERATDIGGEEFDSGNGIADLLPIGNPVAQARTIDTTVSKGMKSVRYDRLNRREFRFERETILVAAIDQYRYYQI